MPNHAITDEDLLRLPKDGRKYELVDGEIRVSPAGGRHGEIAVRLAARLFAFVSRKSMGKVFDSSTGFRLPSRRRRMRNLRSPDISFVAAGRFPGGRVPAGFIELAPDLAVEILSPEDRRRDVLEKVGQFLDAGVRLIWVIDPEARKAATYRSLTTVRHVGEHDALGGEDVVPGFRCRLSDLLE